MTAIVVLNVILAAFVIVGVLSLLAWGIAADRRDRTERLSAVRQPATRAALPTRAGHSSSRPATVPICGLRVADSR